MLKNLNFGSNKNLLLTNEKILAGAMTQKYRSRSGFAIASPITLLGFKGNAEMLYNQLQNKNLPALVFSNLSENNFQIAAEWHNKAGLMYRPNYWMKYPTMSSSISKVADSSDSGQTLGFASIFPFMDGYRVGSLYASSFDVALALTKELLHDLLYMKGIKAEFFHFSVPSNNKTMLQFLNELNFEFYRTLDRSYTKRDENDFNLNSLAYSTCYL